MITIIESMKNRKLSKLKIWLQKQISEINREMSLKGSNKVESLLIESNAYSEVLYKIERLLEE